MRRFLRVMAGLVVLAALAVACQDYRLSGQVTPGPRPAGALRVATHNVHYILLREAEGDWSVGDWHRRKHAVDAAFKTVGADIFAFQEMESFAGGDNDDVNLARSFLAERNPDYAIAAIGDWRRFPSTQPVFYRKDRLTALDQGWFFFSETPDTIYSRTFDGGYPAFASWVRFRVHHTGEVLRVVNLHLDYGSRENRLRSAALVRDRIKGWGAGDERIVLLGDLNALRGSDVHDILSEAGLTFLRIPGATYHFNRGLDLFGAIDHIGVKGFGRSWGDPVVLRDRPGGVWPSDHYPVMVDLVID